MRGAYDTEFAAFASGKAPPVSPARGARALTFCRPRTISETRDERPPSGGISRVEEIAMRPKRKPLRRAEDLLAAGLISPARRAAIDAVAARYALALTADLADLVDAADPCDPIARQFIPDEAELASRPEEMGDPIGDGVHSPVNGIVHRYPDRVLLKPVRVCAAYCRFCFRREVVGRQRGLSRRELDAAIDYIRAHCEIWEVILTGGDPLVLSARRLKELVAALAAIAHVKVIRVHSRVPVAEPSRVTAALARALKASGKATYVVLHANHARELTPGARAACARLIDAGIPMLSQSVLLRGLNDNAAALGELMRALVECRIKPYYLHHGDLAPGTAHWRTSIHEGQALMRTLRGRLSGLCQPTYVLDIPGGHGKSPIGPSYLARAGGENETARYEVEDFNGRRHGYPPVGSVLEASDREKSL
jgi:lysine 2,3-aminomutase